MNIKRNSSLSTVPSLIGALFLTAGVLTQLSACPDDNCNNNGGGTGDHSAQDPVFLLSEKKPIDSAKEKLGQLKQQISGRKNAAGEEEKAVLQGYEALRKQDVGQIYAKTQEIWGQGLSPELKQYVILASLPLVKSTEEADTLRFMLSSMQDIEPKLTEIKGLARGNRLEKAKAARLLAILSRNPQFKL